MKTKLNIALCLCMATAVSLAVACKKTSSTGNGNGGGTNPPVVDSTYNPVDPPVAATVGFFQNGWQAKSFVAPDVMDGTLPSGNVTDSLIVNVNNVLAKVPLYVYGNNSNLWMGQIVTEPTLMGYIKDLSPNIIRAPAGSVSDVYFFNQSSAPPADAPARLMNADGTDTTSFFWYGGNTESWTFSLDNYYKLLAQTNITGLITINYGYARYGTSANPVAAAAHLAADWVRYDNGRTKFWEIGNETYGNWEAGYRIDVTQNKDGQPEIITGALYGQHVKVFADSMRAAAKEIGATIYIGATLYDTPTSSGNTPTEKSWNVGVLTQAGNTPDFFIVHDYFTTYGTNSSVADILGTSTTVPNQVMNYVKSQITAAGLDMKPIALTEWNIRATGSKQNVSYVAGMHVAKTLGSIIKNQFGEASRWDLANGWDNGDDQGLFNNGDETGAPKWNPRPAYFYQYYFEKCFGDRMVFDTLKAINADLTTYSSTFSSGEVGTVIINSGIANHILSIDYQHFPAGSKYYWYVLTGGADNAPFSGQVFVNGTGPSTATGGPLNYASIKAYSAPLEGTIKVGIPAMSVVYLVSEKK